MGYVYKLIGLLESEEQALSAITTKFLICNTCTNTYPKDKLEQELCINHEQLRIWAEAAGWQITKSHEQHNKGTVIADKCPECASGRF